MTVTYMYWRFLNVSGGGVGVILLISLIEVQDQYQKLLLTMQEQVIQ